MCSGVYAAHSVPPAICLQCVPPCCRVSASIHTSPGTGMLPMSSFSLYVHCMLQSEAYWTMQLISWALPHAGAAAPAPMPAAARSWRPAWQHTVHGIQACHAAGARAEFNGAQSLLLYTPMQQVSPWGMSAPSGMHMERGLAIMVFRMMSTWSAAVYDATLSCQCPWEVPYSPLKLAICVMRLAMQQHLGSVLYS
jgi:hypothetical protein